jgi:hypothetical protein
MVSLTAALLPRGNVPFGPYLRSYRSCWLWRDASDDETGFHRRGTIQSDHAQPLTTSRPKREPIKESRRMWRLVPRQPQKRNVRPKTPSSCLGFAKAIMPLTSPSISAGASALARNQTCLDFAASYVVNGQFQLLFRRGLSHKACGAFSCDDSFPSRRLKMARHLMLTLVLILAGIATAADDDKYQSIDLQPYANQKRGDSFGVDEQNNLGKLPGGKQTFGGVKFTIEQAIIQLGSSAIDTLPSKGGRSQSGRKLLQDSHFACDSVWRWAER